MRLWVCSSGHETGWGVFDSADYLKSQALMIINDKAVSQELASEISERDRSHSQFSR